MSLFELVRYLYWVKNGELYDPNKKQESIQAW